MFTPTLRIILALIALITAVFFFNNKDYLSMSLMLISCGLFIHGYFKSGTVYIAVQKLKNQDLKKAEELISKIKNPEKLSKGQKSYYHFTKGIIASEKQTWDDAYFQLTEALRIGLRTKNDTSIVLLHLANIELERKNYYKANDFIYNAKQFELQPLVQKEINRIENEIKLAQE